MRIFSFLAIGLLLAEVVIGAPFAPDNTEATQETEEKFSTTTPHFLSQPLQLVVDEGHEVRLPCMLDHLEGFLLIWRKNNRIISIGDRIVHKSASKFHIEESENGNTLVIENVDETDEAHFSCCISANSETEIDHNVIVIKKDQNELEEGETATKMSEATTQEIENVEQGSGLEPEAIEKSIKKEAQNYEEEALMNEDDANSAGKIYFARVPSFYTFPDEDKKVVTEREQLIKHAPTSVIEFLRLLKIHHNSVLTKDDVEEFNEFMFQKKPIPNTHLLRGTHAYNSNWRKRLQTANIKEIENKKRLTEKVIETEDLESGLMHETDYSSDISIQEVAESEEEYVENTSNLSEEVHQDSYTESEVKENESEVSIEEGKDEKQLSESEVSTEEALDEEHVSESEASTEEVKDEESVLENKVVTNKIILHDVKWYENRPAYSLTADRYLDENEIGYSKKKEDVLKEKSVPMYRGQHQPESTLEDSILETHTISQKELVDSQSDEDYTVKKQIKKEGILEEESDNAELLESDEDYTVIEQIKKEDVVEKETDNAELLENNEDEESITIDEEKIIHHDVKWYENRPAYSLTADRYLDENEIGYSESEVYVQKERSIPLYRGQHHHANTLEESLIEKVIDENESERYSESKDIRSEDVPHFEPVPKEIRQDTDLKDGVEERTYDTIGEDSEESLETKSKKEEEEEEEEEEREEEDEKEEALNEGLNMAELIYGDRLNANEPESESNFNGDVKFRTDQHLSHSSHRYLKSSEIGQVVKEKEILTKKMMIPVIRGQHLPVSTLEEFNIDHMTYSLTGHTGESSESEEEGKLKHSESSNKFHQVHDTKKSEEIYTDDRVDIEKLLKGETEFQNKLGDGTDKEILYPKEIMAMERRYFTKNIKEENTEEGRHPLLISHHDIVEKESDKEEDYKPEEYTHEADIKEEEKYNLIGSVYHSEDEDEKNEEDVEEDKVTVEYQRETDQNENAINRPLLYDQDIKIDEVAHIVTADHLHKNDDATDKDMIPLKVLHENINEEKDVEFESDMRSNKRKNRRDGPHPFRFICMLRKCS